MRERILIVDDEINGLMPCGPLQSITTDLEFGAYPTIKVKAGVPVKWTINAKPGKLNGCNNEIIIPTMGVTKELKEGENVIEFT